MKLKLPAREDAEVDMAPMIDLVFLLLIFFMVASVVVSKKVEVELPKSQAATVPEDIKGRVILSVDANDQIYYGMVIVTLDELKEIIAQELELDPDLRIMIRADQTVLYEQLKKIMIACGDVGATDLIYATYEE
jgi:biopolymer transport protein ExbD